MSEITLLSNRELMELKTTSLSNDGRLFECITPGCATMEISRRGYTTLSGTSFYMMWGQLLSLTNPGFLISKLIDANHDVFQIYTEHYITLGFYTKTQLQHNLYYPMKISTRAQSVGRSTLTLVSVVRNAVTNTPLACSSSTLVRVDLKTRSSAPIPDDIRNRFPHHANQHKPKRDSLNISPPADAFQQSVVTRVSEADTFRRVGQASYATYCIDAATSAASQNKLNGFTADMAPCLVRNYRCDYAVETLAKETLKVSLWLDELQPDLIHFRIYRVDGQLVYSSRIEFYLNEEVDITLDNLISDESIDLKSPASTDSTFVLSDVDLSRWKHVSYNKDRTRAELILPRPLISIHNPKGRIPIASFPDYFRFAHRAVTVDSGFCANTVALVPEDCAFFVVQMEYFFERDLFKISTDHDGLYRPFRSVVKFHSFTRSTTCLEIKLYDTESGACIATSYMKQLTVDYATRKAVPIPASLRQRYSEICSNQEGLKPVPDLPSPDECFTHYDTVRHSDINLEQHLNMAAYVKLCMDATVAASDNGGLLNFVGDALSREMKSISCSFVKECDVDETLQVKVWQDEVCEDRLNFRVTKSNGSLSMLCSMQFYPTESHSKL